MSLKEYIDNLDDTQAYLIRCCSCLNEIMLSDPNMYTIETYESPHASKTFEGMICLDCTTRGRQIEKAIVLAGPNNNIISYMQIVRPKPIGVAPKDTAKAEPIPMAKPGDAKIIPVADTTSSNTMEPNKVQ